MFSPAKIFGYLIIVYSLFSCTQRKTNSGESFYSENKIKKEYLKLLDDTNENMLEAVSISLDSTSWVSNQFLNHFFPNTEFWILMIRNFSHYDCNGGNIPAVVAFSKLDSNDVRILLPFNYAESSKNFFDVFYNEPIREKEKCCRAITNLFFKTHILPAFCEETLYQLNQSIENTNKYYTVTTSWHQKCRVPVGIDVYKDSTDSASIKTKFYFKGNKIKEIDYQEWVRQSRRRQ